MIYVKRILYHAIGIAWEENQFDVRKRNTLNGELLKLPHSKDDDWKAYVQCDRDGNPCHPASAIILNGREVREANITVLHGSIKRW